ncbi:MAG: nitroreductase family protein [Planctomycetota bacterium]
MNDFPDLVRKARSFRRFVEKEPLGEAFLRSLVDLARIAPCSGNLQPLRYRIVLGPACAKVFPHLRWAARLKGWGGPKEGERPTGYILILSPAAQKNPPLTDVGIAAQTMQLAATAAGFGLCQLGSIDRPAIQQALALPAEWRIDLVLAVGRPAEKVILDEAKAGQTLAYYRTPDDVHHVPKLSLDDVLV